MDSELKAIRLFTRTLKDERITNKPWAEFKQKAIELTHARGSVSEIYKELDIPRFILGRWCKESVQFGQNSFSGHGNPNLTDIRYRWTSTQYPKKGDSHPLLEQSYKYRFPVWEDVQIVQEKQKWILKLVLRKDIPEGVAEWGLSGT